ncbi:MAG: high frequency lysogenization protein HflD [Gammaproteobacteria bacterium]|nr:high frequency lysogenization protein HflD [Gammaproteobacteria bacterium]
MKHTQEDRTLALAGVFQAAKLVEDIARTGQVSGAAMESCLETLFKFDSASVGNVYGGIAELSTGLKTLIDQMSSDSDKKNMDITRYVISLLHLEKKLSKNKPMLDKMSKGLENTQNQMEYFSLTHENVLANLAGLYQDTISTLMPRIIVQGEQNYLSQQSNANKIRALLLAGIRSAVLWRQCGGNKLQFLFGRKSYLNTSKELLAQI